MTEVVREAGAHRCDHLVQVYRDPAELAESVVTFFSAGLDAGDPAVAIVTAAHWPVFRQRLERRGHDVAQLEGAGMLTLRDADETLAAIYDGASLSERRFNAVVGGVFDLVAAGAPRRHIRAFGEMVDVLVRRGELAAADTLESFWNTLAEKRQFSLLCGYRADLFDTDVQATLLPQVYRTHTHVLPTADAERIELAVGRALAEVLGEADAQKVYSRVARLQQAPSAPASQLALLWVSAHMPRTASEVLARARTHYTDAAAS